MSDAKRDRTRKAIVVHADRSVPTEYEGKLEPNYYCRAWNGKPGRRKYCKSVAGRGTTHPGIGRCKIHGGLQEGDGRILSGKYSDVKDKALADLLDDQRNAPDPLAIDDELALARAVLNRELLKGTANAAQIGDYLDLISKMLHRLAQQRSATSVPRADVIRAMSEIGRAVDAAIADEIKDVALLERINRRIYDGWRSVRL